MKPKKVNEIINSLGDSDLIIGLKSGQTIVYHNSPRR